MNRAYCHAMILVPMLAALVTISGCGSKESKFEGTYQNPKDKMTLVINPDHKGSLTDSGKPADITWEMAADDKIIVHAPFPITMFYTSDGNLRDEQGAVWVRK